MIDNNWAELVHATYSWGILLGLVVGKPLGVSLLIAVAVGLKLVRLPSEINWTQLVGAGMLAGIGFTMSIFITMLAFDDAVLVNNAKIAILGASLVAAALGYATLKLSSK